MSRPGKGEDRVESFWTDFRAKADDDQQSGYLTDEWPAAMADNRFAGERAAVDGWLDSMQITSGRCLDVGCGTGIWLEHFAGRFDRAIGIDLSSAMAESTARRLERSGIDNAEARQASVLELGDESDFDFVFLGGLLMYVDDSHLNEVASTLCRITKPGGLVILRESTHRRETWYRESPLSPGLFAIDEGERPPYFANYRPAKVIRESLERAGLEVTRVLPNPHYKLSDLTEAWLWTLNRLFGGKLRTDHERAQAWAQRIYRWRWFTLWPQYWLIRKLYPRYWSIDNHWFICRRPR
jgi:SAM-dependent methyltransferase